jgi:sugar phosphate isomerase/epimerase
MLRLAVMSLSYQRAFAAGAMDLFSYIKTSRELGLDGVDLHGRHFVSTDTDYLWRLKRACIESGLTIACVSVPNNFAHAAEALPAELEKTRRMIDAAAFLGAPLVRVFAGWSEHKDEQTWGRVVSCLRQSAAYGESKGIVVALQNHNHGGVAALGKDVLRLMDDVAHPNLSHVLDTGQYLDLYDSIVMTAARAVHVRCKIYQIETGEERKLDYTRIFPILHGVNYNGFLSIVYEGSEDERFAVSKAVPYLRGFMSGVARMIEG